MSGLGDLVRVLRLGDLDLDDRLGLDLDLEDLLGLDLLLDLGLPVLDLVLALESGEPDCDLVLALPEPDLERPLTDGDPEVPGTEAEGGLLVTMAETRPGGLVTGGGLDTDIPRQLKALVP